MLLGVSEETGQELEGVKPLPKTRGDTEPRQNSSRSVGLLMDFITREISEEGRASERGGERGYGGKAWKIKIMHA